MGKQPGNIARASACDVSFMVCGLHDFPCYLYRTRALYFTEMFSFAGANDTVLPPAMAYIRLLVLLGRCYYFNGFTQNKQSFRNADWHWSLRACFIFLCSSHCNLWELSWPRFCYFQF